MPLLVKPNHTLLDAVHLATQKLSEVEDANAVLKDVLSICIEAVEAEGGSIYIHEPAAKRLRFLHVLPEEVADRLERLDISDDFGVAGRVFQSGQTEISHFSRDGDPSSRSIREKSGVVVDTMITLPLQIKGLSPIGVVQLVNKRKGDFTEEDQSVLETVADVCTFAVTNARLLEQRRRVAALEGMGRSAHDLANKAGVLMTFLPDFERNIEALKGVLRLQGVKGEALFYLDMLEGTFRDVFAPYSERVYRYARLINDLAAGKPLTPKLKQASLAHVVEEAVQFMEPQARRNRVGLITEVEYTAPDLEFDDLFIIRIVENLVGNAIKAVHETIPGTWVSENYDDPDARYSDVVVRTRYADGVHSISVTDSGPGLSPGQIRGILGGTARSSWGQSAGSGLGTKVILELVQALDGRLSIHSKLGEGATFLVELPVK